MTGTELAGAIGTVALSGVAAAAVSSLMTGRWERRKALLERRLTAAADFAGAASRASFALDQLADKIRNPALPGRVELAELLDQVKATDDEIGHALEKTGLLRVLYGPTQVLAGQTTSWGNHMRAATRAAAGYLHVIAPTNRRLARA